MATKTEQMTVDMIENADDNNPTDDIELKTKEINQNDSTIKSEIVLTKFKEILDPYDIDSSHKAITEYVQGYQRDLYPSPFLDNLFPKDWHDHAVPPDDPNLNFKARIRRSVIVITTPLTFLFIATLKKGFEMADVIGGTLIAAFTLYFAQVFYYVFFAKDGNNERRLYRVYSISDVPDKWTRLKTGYVQLLYREESIQSISELSAINGGVTKTMLNTLGAYTWCAVLIHFVGQLYYNRPPFSWDAADLCEMIGCVGLLLISIFELDPFSRPMQIMHYVGAALGTCTIIGYILQQRSIGTKLWFAILIGVIAAIFFILWQLVGIATDVAQIESKAKYMPHYLQKIEEAKKNGREPKISILQPCVCKCLKGKDVNTYSKLNIVFEAIFLYLGAFSLCMWLIDYDTGCDLGCAGPKQ